MKWKRRKIKDQNVCTPYLLGLKVIFCLENININSTTIVTKPGSDISSVYELDHWVTSSTSGSMVELHGQVKKIFKIKYI